MSSVDALQEWFQSGPEGQLSVDVVREGAELVVRAFVAGVQPKDLDISLHGDLLTIRGERKMSQDVQEEDFLYRECYWGGFSRSLVLPYDVAGDVAEASMKNGLLEIRIPLRDRPQKLSVKWEE